MILNFLSTRCIPDAAIKKMLSTLDDPFTRFLEPEKFKSLRVWCSHKLWLLLAWHIINCILMDAITFSEVSLARKVLSRV
jgi:hypothetical protein